MIKNFKKGLGGDYGVKMKPNRLHILCEVEWPPMGVGWHLYALEKEMATHSSVPAWRIPGTGEPGGLPSVGSHRVGPD